MQLSIIAQTKTATDELLLETLSARVTQGLVDVADQITHAEVELADEHGASAVSGLLCCSIEARLRGRQPVLVAHQASSVDTALAGALTSLLRVIESARARRRDQLKRYFPPPIPSLLTSELQRAE